VRSRICYKLTKINLVRQGLFAQDIWRKSGGIGMNIESAAPGSPAGSPAAWLAGGVLNAALRGVLRDLNARFLVCLQRMSDVDLGHLGFVPSVARLLRGCDIEGTPAIAGCPYALFDAAFGHHEFWRAICGAASGQGASREHRTAASEPPEPWPDCEALTEMVLFFAWHLASANPLATRLVLGMAPATADLLGSCSFPAVASVARTRRYLLRPRWPQRMLFWRRLLAITTHSTGAEMASAQLVGIQLMATEGAIGPGQPASAGRRR
jgi:hypothetical protein